MHFSKIALVVFSLLIAVQATAEPNYQKLFSDVEPCFTMYDLQQHKTIASFNNARCETRLSPCSTFKLPLILIGFDSGILKDEDHPLWKFKSTYPVAIESHAQDHTPKSWMANSVVWYSQKLTKKLGMKQFKKYLALFDYGNQDVSGNPGKNDGLTQSWLTSSLKISANEQIVFLDKILTHRLPVSQMALQHTQNILFIETLPNGWKLYGKTGSGALNNGLRISWFVGWLEKAGQTYIFAVNIQDQKKFNEFGERRARAIAKEIFKDLEVLS